MGKSDLVQKVGGQYIAFVFPNLNSGGCAPNTLLVPGSQKLGDRSPRSAWWLRLCRYRSETSDIQKIDARVKLYIDRT
jgi:hypothetical protein